MATDNKSPITSLTRLYAENVADMPRFAKARERLDVVMALEGDSAKRDKILKCYTLLEGARADWEEMQECLRGVIRGN